MKLRPPRNDAQRQEPVRLPSETTDAAPEFAFFATHGTCGILDAGATKSLIGSKLLPAFIESLPREIRKSLFRTSCEITFQLGNQGTLDSSQAIVVPLKSTGLGFKIAIVPGETPLILSNTFIRCQ